MTAETKHKEIGRPRADKFEEPLFSFDGGQYITFSEGAHNILVTGSTGSGKTTSFILPALYNLISRGAAGLCVDIKGNMTRQIRAFAGLCGRESDILELGTGSEARPLNLLNGLGPDKIHEMFRALTLKDRAPGHNMSWYMAGVRVATDLALLCRQLAGFHVQFTPSLSLIGDLLSEYPLCAKIFSLLEKIDLSTEGKSLRRSVENDCFHPCRWLPMTERSKTRDDYDQQVEWRTYATRHALQYLRETPGIERGFCSPGGAALDMEGWIYDHNKIVILRFDVQSGAAGEDLSRHCLEDFYKAVFSRGLASPQGRYTFLVADEFQEFVNFDRRNRHNDNVFIAKSREFKNIFLAASQSLSALANRGGGQAQLEAFMNNINNSVMFYSTDPWTQEIARRNKGADLSALKPGQVMFSKFNQVTRRHDHCLARVQDVHELCRLRLRRSETASTAASPPDSRPIQAVDAAPIELLRQALERFEKPQYISDRETPTPPLPESEPSPPSRKGEEPSLDPGRIPQGLPTGGLTKSQFVQKMATWREWRSDEFEFCFKPDHRQSAMEIRNMTLLIGKLSKKIKNYLDKNTVSYSGIAALTHRRYLVGCSILWKAGDTVYPFFYGVGRPPSPDSQDDSEGEIEARRHTLSWIGKSCSSRQEWAAKVQCPAFLESMLIYCEIWWAKRPDPDQDDKQPTLEGIPGLLEFAEYLANYETFLSQAVSKIVTDGDSNY